jgi:hypothetical protein
MKYLLFFPLTLWILLGVALAGEPRVLFEDAFHKRPGDGWTWLRENKDAWRTRNDALEIRIEPGVAPTVKNALLRKAPDRSKLKFAVEVTVTFTTPPTQQYEQGGITWYHEGKPVFKLVHEHIDGKEWIIPGKKPAPGKTVQLRLVVDGRRWTAQYRQDAMGKFQTVGTGQLPPPGRDEVSIQCYNGPPDAAHWIRFDNFRIVELGE